MHTYGWKGARIAAGLALVLWCVAACAWSNVTVEQAIGIIRQFEGDPNLSPVAEGSNVFRGHFYAEQVACWRVVLGLGQPSTTGAALNHEWLVSQDSGDVVRAVYLDRSETYNGATQLLPTPLTESEAAGVAASFAQTHYPSFASIQWTNSTSSGNYPGTVEYCCQETLPNGARSVRNCNVAVSLATGQVVRYSAVVRASLPAAAYAEPSLTGQAAMQQAVSQYPSLSGIDASTDLAWSEKDGCLVWGIAWGSDEPLPLDVPGGCLVDAQTGVIVQLLGQVPGVSGPPARKNGDLGAVAGACLAGFLVIALAVVLLRRHAKR